MGLWVSNLDIAQEIIQNGYIDKDQSWALLLILPGILQETVAKSLNGDALLKRHTGNILNQFKELFLPYWSDSSDSMVTVPTKVAAELVLKMVLCWNNQTLSEKVAGEENV